MRLKLTVAYVGTAYSGWQRQPTERTVQGVLEAAVAAIVGRPVGVTGAGRTDAGVHASGQVAHLDVDDRIPPARWRSALNANLPADVRAIDCRAASEDFHARYGARRKTYRYAIDESPVASPFLAPFAWHVGTELDVEGMRAAAVGLLEGNLDQRAFASRPENADRPRPLESVTIERNRLLTLTVVGRSFLRYAVRGMVGTLVEVGRGRREPGTVAQLARSGARESAGATAPPHGLCLAVVDYTTP